MRRIEQGTMQRAPGKQGKVWDREGNNEHFIRERVLGGGRWGWVIKCESMACNCSQFSVSLAVLNSLSNRHTEGLRLFPTSVFKTCT